MTNPSPEGYKENIEDLRRVVISYEMTMSIRFFLLYDPLK